MVSDVNRIPFNDLKRIPENGKIEILDLFKNILNSGSFILGEQTNFFEKEFADYLGIKHVISCGNGTDAIQIALRSVMVEPKDLVLVAANAGGYATTAINLVGATPIYVDIDRNTHLLTLETLKEAVTRMTEKPKAIVITNLYGSSTESKKIAEWSKELGIWLIEDCAQSIGAEIDGKKTGCFSDVSTTSFYPTKNLGALGDGGAIMTNNSNIAHAAKQLRQYGWEEKYTVTKKFGTNSRLDELQAAVLRLRLTNLHNLNRRRQEIHKMYEDALPKNVKAVNKVSPSFVAHLAVIEVENRNRVIDFFNSRKIDTAIHYPIPDHLQKGINVKQAKFEFELNNTEFLVARILSVPLYPELRDDEIYRIQEALSDLWKFG